MNLRRTLTLRARLQTSPHDADTEFPYSHPRLTVNIRDRILEAGQHLFAKNGYERTTTKQLAEAAHISEGTFFRYFKHKKDLLVEIVSQGWSVLLTDLLIELSEMPSDRAIAPMLKHWIAELQMQSDLIRVALMEVQYHPELSARIETEVLSKMTSVTEAFVSDGIARGNYRQLNPRHVAHIFLSLFMVIGLEPTAFHSTPAEQLSFAETLSDLFLNGVLTPSAKPAAVLTS
ncbi:MAG: TetR/AcrR family transcriptional regulator [Cyanobacteria bacterium P01_F01_bin.42]